MWFRVGFPAYFSIYDYTLVQEQRGVAPERAEYSVHTSGYVKCTIIIHKRHSNTHNLPITSH